MNNHYLPTPLLHRTLVIFLIGILIPLVLGGIGMYWGNRQEVTPVPAAPSPFPSPTPSPSPPPSPTPTPFITYCCEYTTQCQNNITASVYVKNHVDYVGDPHMSGTCQFAGYASTIDANYYQDSGCTTKWQAPIACIAPPRIVCCKQQQVFCSDRDAYTPYKKYLLFSASPPPESECRDIIDPRYNGKGLYTDATCSTDFDQATACNFAVRVR